MQNNLNGPLRLRRGSWMVSALKPLTSSSRDELLRPEKSLKRCIGRFEKVEV